MSVPSMQLLAAKQPVAGGFDPLTLSPALWLDAADTATITESGGAVSRWADKSGNVRHFGQTTAANKPTTGAATKNGHNVLTLDGNDNLTCTGFGAALSSGAEIFIVLKLDADPPAATSEIWVFGNAGATSHYPWGGDNGIYDAFGTNSRKTTGNPTPSLANWHTYNVTSVSGAWSSRINNAAHYSTASNTVGWTTTFSLAWFGGGIKGNVAEVLMFAGALATGDRTDVYDYLVDKWGL